MDSTSSFNELLLQHNEIGDWSAMVNERVVTLFF